MIIDYQHQLQYIITDSNTQFSKRSLPIIRSCQRASIPGKIKPFLSFPTYTFNGNLTYNGTSCNEWTGCHDYEVTFARDNMPFRQSISPYNCLMYLDTTSTI